MHFLFSLSLFDDDDDDEDAASFFVWLVVATVIERRTEDSALCSTAKNLTDDDDEDDGRWRCTLEFAEEYIPGEKFVADVDANAEEYERGDVWVLEDGETIDIVEAV